MNDSVSGPRHINANVSPNSIITIGVSTLSMAHPPGKNGVKLIIADQSQNSLGKHDFVLCSDQVINSYDV